MFTHVCTSCERRQLTFLGQVSSTSAVADGIEVTFTCWCGSEQTGVLADLTATRTSAPARRDLVAA